jgi:tetratricopeptide (TPR) repeat protein
LAAKAQAAREAGNPDEALRLYQEALRLKPAWAEGWWFTGTLHYEADRYQEGRDAFRHLLSNAPKMATGWGMLGLCEFQTKQYAEALAHLQRADSLGLGGHDEIRDIVNYHRALLFTRESDFDQAMGLIALAVVRGKDSSLLVEAMGIAALRKPVLPSELPPTEREIVMNVGRALCDGSARRIADATTEFDAILKKYPDTPQLPIPIGRWNNSRRNWPFRRGTRKRSSVSRASTTNAPTSRPPCRTQKERSTSTRISRRRTPCGEKPWWTAVRTCRSESARSRRPSS